MVTEKAPRRAATTSKRRAASRRKPLGQIIADLTKDVPDKELAKLPRDGSANHDHYIYGTPKQY
jgi:hypothetical protein